MTDSNNCIPDEKVTAKDLFMIGNFRLIWSGQVISDFGNSMTRLALLLLINELTGSVAAMASMTIVLAIPRLIFGMLSGVYVDRLNRKTIMVISDVLRGIAVLGFMLVDSPDKIWILYVIGFLQGSVATFFEPARMAILPNLIPKSSLLAANSISQTSQIIFGVLGTAAAGFLIGFVDNYRVVFGIDGLTFILSAVLVSQIQYVFIKSDQKEDVEAKIIFGQLVEGIRISFGHRILLGTLIAFSLTMLGVGAINILMVPLLINELMLPETWFGAINLVQTMGMIASGALIAGLSSRLKPTRMLSPALMGFGIFLAALSLPTQIWHVMVVLFLLALFIPPIQSSGMTIMQTVVPDELRGRTGAARSTLVEIANLISMGAAGLLADSIGTRVVFIISGVIVILAGISSALIFRGVDLTPIAYKQTGQSQISPASAGSDD
ncbi:MAG: MFS transporter [Anaerolineaceae bacterium]|nr:MFS transporter [Anaerolineaceae bacterium]